MHLLYLEKCMKKPLSNNNVLARALHNLYYSSIALDAWISFLVTFGFKKPYNSAETNVPTTNASIVCKT